MIRDNKHRQGFTLIELMLSMAMVSLLLIAIVTMSIQMGRIYTKGQTMFDLNAASRTINTDFTRSFNSIPSIEWRSPQNSTCPHPHKGQAPVLLYVHSPHHSERSDVWL